ncbi:MAG: sigma-70 family RNA polymerase sigma factor [Planctomycetes bacterium]|nr:sigma-70 family RNA polymerase sigma factor [Planctomycetota bacterium]
MEATPRITAYLLRLRDGDAAAAGEMLPLVYEELRQIAGQLLRAGMPGHTLQPTALVHEAWLKIQRAVGGGAGFNDRVHFLAVAARAMRQVLVNHARDRRARKRGGDAQRVPLDECLDVVERQTGDLVALHDTLERLAQDDERQARIVELRVFGGLTIEEVAAALGVAPTTVKADWRFARAWLQRTLGSERQP